MTIIEFLCAAILTGCLSSWVVILLRKWGVTEYCQIHAPKLIAELMSCDYCMNWWLSWVLSVVAAVLTGEWGLLAVPFCSTTIGRFLSA